MNFLVRIVIAPALESLIVAVWLFLGLSGKAAEKLRFRRGLRQKKFSLCREGEILAFLQMALSVGVLFLPFVASVVIHNDVPRVDDKGNILNAHDGTVVQFKTGNASGFWMYGTVYENCVQTRAYCTNPCGYVPNTFAVYHSADLVSWRLVSDNVMPSVSKDNDHINYWMPNVFHNPTTSKYVMQYWSNKCGFNKSVPTGCMSIATADSPDGPFVPTASGLMLHDWAVVSSTMGMWVDPDSGEAYVKFNTLTPQHHSIVKLSPDWLSTDGEARTIFYKTTFPWNEGGGMFKKDGLVYYMTGSDCCFCSWGSTARYWTAWDPLGPWHPGADTEYCHTATEKPHA